MTSTLEKTLQPVESTLPVLPNKITEPLTENILATTPVGKIKKPDRIDYLKKKKLNILNLIKLFLGFR